MALFRRRPYPEGAIPRVEIEGHFGSVAPESLIGFAARAFDAMDRSLRRTQDERRPSEHRTTELTQKSGG